MAARSWVRKECPEVWGTCLAFPHPLVVLAVNAESRANLMSTTSVVGPLSDRRVMERAGSTARPGGSAWSNGFARQNPGTAFKIPMAVYWARV